MTYKKSESYNSAIQLLPESLWPELDRFIEHYKFAAEKTHGKQFVSPIVLAELILIGWRLSADPIQKS